MNKLLNKNKIQSNMSYDKHFDEERKHIRKITIKEYKKILNEISELRDIAQDTIMILFADEHYYVTSRKRADTRLSYLILSCFTRMIKTSKVITDLCIHGDYVEALSLLRNNFERSTLIMYLILEPNLINKWLEMKNEKNYKKRIQIQKEFFSVSKMVNKLRKDYKQYEILSISVHPDILIEDSYLIEQPIPENMVWIGVNRYPEFSLPHFAYISELNYNVLLETFLEIKKFMLSYADKRKLKGTFKERIDISNKFEPMKIIIKNNRQNQPKPSIS